MPKSNPRPPAPGVPAMASEPTTYEAALSELEQLIARLDAGQLPLDELLVQYQRGAQLLAFCRGRLQSVEDQIKVLDQGELVGWTAS
ncbi:MAG: exodeoxyribonuclease VII small subunit [Burkholderiaceae bacterium]|nr:exodeoxyribonuclease VII small subunit [Burkholderiaceae bacterium]MDP3423560.1 exodeoxyribonuclease VII small subunit [Burkholderiaceae bacterium]MDZ4160656.1 exodeoxyribonuclease VII small subunit [Burkholderiales bacterium]